jgi:O-antigen ligase
VIASARLPRQERLSRPNHRLEIGLSLLAAIAFTTMMIVVSEASLTWLLLIIAGLGCVAALLWLKDMDVFLLFMTSFTIGIELSKALIVSGGVYAPGLSLYLSDLFLVPLILKWLIHGLVSERRLPGVTRVQGYSLLFLAWVWSTAVRSADVQAGILASVTFTKFVVTYLMLADLLRRPGYMKILLMGFASGLGVQILYAAAQVATGSPLELQGGKVAKVGVNLVFDVAGGVHAFRPSGFLSHPNIFADYLTTMLPPAFALVFLCRRQLGRAWLPTMALACGGTIALVLTLSRGGWIAFAAAIAFMIAVALHKRLVEARHVGAVLAGTVVCVLTAVTLVYPAAYLRITESDSRSSEGRWAMMEQALLIIQRNPVAGVGFGGYNRAAQSNVPESFGNLGEHFQKSLLEGVVHNKYLLVAAEHGLVGLALFCWVIWIHFTLLWSVPAWRSRSEFALALGVTGAIVAGAVFFLLDHFYLDVRIQLFWVLFALLYALVQLQPAAAKRSPAIAFRGATQ